MGFGEGLVITVWAWGLRFGFGGFSASWVSEEVWRCFSGASDFEVGSGFSILGFRVWVYPEP